MFDVISVCHENTVVIQKHTIRLRRACNMTQFELTGIFSDYTRNFKIQSQPDKNKVIRHKLRADISHY